MAIICRRCWAAAGFWPSLAVLLRRLRPSGPHRNNLPRRSAAFRPPNGSSPWATCTARTTGSSAILRAAGLVDGRARWIGGRAILVQTGDVLDRGPASRRVLDLLRQLERDAARAGGQVHALIGNHEVMRIVGHWNDVSAAEYAAFRQRDSEEVRDRLFEILSADAAKRARAAGQPFDADAFRRLFVKEIPLGYVEMRQAFGPDGEYGKWLRQHSAMVVINGVAFVHGGVDVDSATLGCEGINAGVTQDVSVVDPTPEQILAMLVGQGNGAVVVSRTRAGARRRPTWTRF